MKTVHLPALALGALFASTLHAGESGTSRIAESALIAPSRSNEWEFSLEPYGWLASVEGKTGVGGFPAQSVSVPFKEILKRLDMTAALQAEVRHGRWSLLLDGMYLKISDRADFQDRMFNSIDVGLEQVLLEAALAYRVWEGEKGYVDLLAGARYLKMTTSLDFSLNPAGVRSVSEEVSSRIVDQATQLVQGEVSDATRRARAQLAAAVGNAQSEIDGQLDEIRGNVRQAAIDRILENNSIIEIIRKIRNLSPEQIENIRETKELIQAQRELVNALVQEKASAALAEAKSQLASELARTRRKAQQAVAKAQKSLAKAIEKAVKETFDEGIEASRGWVDPFIGFRARYQFNDKFYAALRADIGGFGVSSDLAWQAFGVVGWQINRSWSAELGYRYLDVDYDRAGFLYQMRTSGVFTGLKYTF